MRKTAFDLVQMVRIYATDASGEEFIHSIKRGRSFHAENLEEAKWQLEGCEWKVQYYIPSDDTWYDQKELLEVDEVLKQLNKR